MGLLNKNAGKNAHVHKHCIPVFDSLNLYIKTMIAGKKNFIHIIFFKGRIYTVVRQQKRNVTGSTKSTKVHTKLLKSTYEKSKQ